MTGRLKDLTLNRDGTQNITITVRADFRESFDELADKDITVEIKRLFKHRSLDANAYCWVLIDKIAEKTGEKKSAIYRAAIREIGGVSDTVCVVNRAVDRLCKGWTKQGLGWQSEITESKIEGCKNVTLYYGSSVYDSRQMAQLIDSLIQDAEALGIPTVTEKELNKMMGHWKERANHGNEG